MQIKKQTVKDLLESYAKQQCKFTPIQFLTLLRVLSRKKDGTTSEFTQKLLAPLYIELSANRLPHHGLVLVVLEKLNRPFFRRKKNQDGGEEDVMAKTPGMRVKASNFTSGTKNPVAQSNRDAELRKKLTEQWRQKVADGYKSGEERNQGIKSVGNGL